MTWGRCTWAKQRRVANAPRRRRVRAYQQLSRRQQRLRSDLLWRRLSRQRERQRLDFLKSTLASENVMLMSGACSALLYDRFVPSERDMIEIIGAVETIDASEGQVMTPRCYIAALAYLWPLKVTSRFLEACKRSRVPVPICNTDRGRGILQRFECPPHHATLGQWWRLVTCARWRGHCR